MINPTNINWYPIPFVRLLIFFSLGIVFSVYSDWITGLNFVFAPALLLSVFLALKIKSYKWRWVVGLSLHVSLFLSGYLLTHAAIETNRNTHFSHKVDLLEPQYVYVTGIVDNQPNPKKNIKAELAVRSIGRDIRNMHSCTGKLLLYLEKDGETTSVNYGDHIAAKLKIRKPQGPINPFDFDFSKYLYFQNIHYQSYAKAKNWKKIAGKKGQTLWHILFDWRQFLMNVLQQNIPSINELTVAEALIIGYRDELPDEVTQAYIDTGAMHVLSVSGLHVGIVAMALEKLLNYRKGRKRKWNRWVLLVAIWIFALLSGASASVLRAAVMFSIVIIGKAYAKNVNTYNILAVSAFVLLVYRPFLLFDIGFQLSYLGLFGILFFQPKLEKIWLPGNELLWKFWQLTSTGIAAQLTTLPISVYTFHQFPIYFWLSGLIVIPASTIILYGGITLFLSSGLPLIPHYLGIILTKVIWLTNSSLQLIQQLPCSVIDDIWFHFPQMLLMYVSIFFVVIGLSLRNYRFIQVAAAMLLIAILPSSFRTWQELHQKKIAIHLLKHGSTIDFIAGKQATSLEFGTIDEKSKKYQLDNCRSFLGVQDLNLECTDANLPAVNPTQRGPFVQFENRRVFLGRGYCSHEVKADIGILLEKFDWDTLQCNIQLDTVIMHPALSKEVQEKCKQYFGNRATLIAIEKPGTVLLDLNPTL